MYVDKDAGTNSKFTQACTESAGLANCKSNYAGTGTTSKNYVRGTANLTTLKTTLTGAGILSSLTWTPGLFKAAKDHATDMASTNPVVTTGNDASTLATRVAKYGTAGTGNTLVENLQATTDTATWVVLSMLIDDTDSGNKARTSLLATTTT